MKIRLILAWYDVWIGAYWDRGNRTLYLMIPMIGVAVTFEKRIVNCDTECFTCGEGQPRDECQYSQRTCGHHCNCAWTQDICHWCGKEFGEVK